MIQGGWEDLLCTDPLREYPELSAYQYNKPITHIDL